ncbi:MAG: spore coat protein CotJB [Clostridia bacterium]|nr:spore coat protein CotJB [Clostridia bacterium]
MMRPNNYNNTCNMCHGNCRDKMKMLRALDFAIQETVLYLDAYPDNQQALDYYHQLIEQRKEVMEEYEKACGPINMYGNKSHTSWDWVNNPWPWEHDAN